MSHMTLTPDSGPGGNSPELRTYRLHRSDAKDLAFEGRLLGRAERKADFPDRSITVSIYVTASGKYVTHIERGALVMNGAPSIEGLPENAKAGVHDTAGAAYDWLVAENRGKLGTLSKAAWNAACATWQDLGGNDVERI